MTSLWLKANWGWLWKAAVILVAALLMWYLGTTLAKWHSAYTELPRVKAEAAEELAAARAETQHVRDQFSVAYSASKEFQRELEVLRNAPREPAPVIRVCKPAPRVPAAGKGSAAAGSDAAAPATGGVSETVEFDTQPLYDAIADECDKLSAQLRALQQFELDR